MMPDAELQALLRLSCVPHLGDVQLGALLRHYGAALPLLEVPAAQLGPWGFERDSALTLRRVERALRTIEDLELTVWSLLDPRYPEPLRTLADRPVLLFARGDLRALDRVGVAVVGTRSPTEYGVSVTRTLVHGLAEAGIVIWSGAARGIDSVAHRAALDAGGATVAVLGCGVDVVYPRESARLFDDIARAGLLLSEFLPGEPPLSHHFPKRNRIIARMPKGVLIIEARVDGGALITAQHAEDYSQVMAVPGPVGRATSLGVNRLIQNGAKLVIDVADVLEEIGGPLNAAAQKPRPSARKRWRRVDLLKEVERDPQQPELGEHRQPAPAGVGAARVAGEAPAVPQLPVMPAELARIYTILERHTAIHIDDLAALAGERVPRVLGALLGLMNMGLAEDAGGKLFKRAERPPKKRSAA